MLSVTGGCTMLHRTAQNFQEMSRSNSCRLMTFWAALCKVKHHSNAFRQESVFQKEVRASTSPIWTRVCACMVYRDIIKPKQTFFFDCREFGRGLRKVIHKRMQTFWRSLEHQWEPTLGQHIFSLFSGGSVSFMILWGTGLILAETSGL